MRLTPVVNPLTSVGTLRCVLVPSPNWPKSFQPQHFAPPLAVTAQLWPQFPANAVTPKGRATLVGVVRRMVVPSPI